MIGVGCKRKTINANDILHHGATRNISELEGDEVVIERTNKSRHLPSGIKSHVDTQGPKQQKAVPSIFIEDPTVRLGPWNETDFCPRFRNVLRVGCWYAAAPETARRIAATETFILIFQ